MLDSNMKNSRTRNESERKMKHDDVYSKTDKIEQKKKKMKNKEIE